VLSDGRLDGRLLVGRTGISEAPAPADLGGLRRIVLLVALWFVRYSLVWAFGGY
jgi:hypothetical protein